MISKELFLEIIELIRKQDEIDKKITKALPLFCDGNGLMFTGQEYQYKALMLLLKESMQDKYDLIDWWLYEDEEKVINVDGTSYDVSTPELLYDFIKDVNNEKL